MLAEVTTTAISREEKPKGFDESLKVARDGGNVAKNTRLDIERRIGRSVLSTVTAQTPKALDETAESVLLEAGTIEEDGVDDDNDEN